MGVIRLLLAVCVLLYHCPPGVIFRFLHPALAVQCFYVISGFLVQFVITSYRAHGGSRWRASFYKSRLLRLFPLYWLLTLLTLLLPGNITWDPVWHSGDIINIAIYIINNLCIFGQDILRLTSFSSATGEFSWILPDQVSVRGGIPPGDWTGNSLTILGQSWSLAVELEFYALAPFLLLCRSYVLAAVMALSIAFRLYLAFHGYKFHSFANAIILSEIALFLAGALACRFYQSVIASALYRRLRIPDTSMWLFGIFNLIMITGYYFIGWHIFPSGGAWDKGLLAVPYGWWGSLVVTACALPFLFHTFRNNRFDRFLGDLSYPVYISHMFFISLLRFSDIPGEWQCVWVLALSIMSAILLHLFIERPMDRLRHRLYLQQEKMAWKQPLLQAHRAV